MKILADRQISCVNQAFSGLGDVILRDGRDITAHEVHNADVLLVRSVTRVDSALLEGSSVKFVASATSGIDHIDTACLESAGIGFASAAGSNAQAVVEYVLSSLFVLAAQHGFRLTDKTVGIIGCGHVGSRLAQALEAMGVRCLCHDPPLKELTGDGKYCEFQQVMQADIITLHVSLTSSGRHATRSLVNENFLSRMQSGAMLINTSRGAVVHEAALKHALQHKPFPVALDVWDNEPAIDRELLSSVAIGTPHIAGYTRDARLCATSMIYRALCEHLQISGAWFPKTEVDSLTAKEIKIAENIGMMDGLEMAILSHYDVRSDAAAFRDSLLMTAPQARDYFDEFRKTYPVRREFAATTVRVVDGKLADVLEKLGFRVATH